MSYPGNPPPYSPPPGATVVQFQPVPNPNMSVITVVQTGQRLGTHPTTMTCSSCQYQIVTKLETQPTTQTHIWAVCLCVFGCWPCAWIPYCTPSCMNVNHYCPNCNAFIGNNQI